MVFFDFLYENNTSRKLFGNFLIFISKNFSGKCIMIKFYTKEVSYFVHISFKTHNTFIIMPFQKLVCKKFTYIGSYLFVRIS